jgi:hypothetical protein
MTSVDTIFGKTKFGDEISDVGFDIEKVDSLHSLILAYQSNFYSF